MNVMGIDPGLKGALASWNGIQLVIREMPIKKAQTRGNEVCWDELVFHWDRDFRYIGQVFLERVHSRPGEGVSSAFKFGTVYGGLLGIIAVKKKPLSIVTPSQWKKHYGLSAQKEEAVGKACELFPEYKDRFYGPRGGLKDGVAEAALIAKYGHDQIGE